MWNVSTSLVFPMLDDIHSTHTEPQTLLDEWLTTCLSPESSGWPMLVYDDDTLSYGDMLRISRGIVTQVLKNARRPTVAIVSPNHPTTLAVFLATWLLNGIVAPIDPHAPPVLLEGMFRSINPHVVVVADTNSTAIEVAHGQYSPRIRTLTAGVSH